MHMLPKTIDKQLHLEAELRYNSIYSMLNFTSPDAFTIELLDLW